MSDTPRSILVLTVSDSIHAGEREDKAGTLAAAALVAHGWEVQRAQSPDELDAIREALPAFGRQIAGFDRDDAVLTGIESRTSSPLRITRDARSLQSLNVRGLYPCGEGAGYAGGILSAGVDGIKVAEAVISEMTT